MKMKILIFFLFLKQLSSLTTEPIKVKDLSDEELNTDIKY